jgi:hypothetical protein
MLERISLEERACALAASWHEHSLTSYRTTEERVLVARALIRHSRDLMAVLDVLSKRACVG